jgi:microcompartment protein CcmK/EutM
MLSRLEPYMNRRGMKGMKMLEVEIIDDEGKEEAQIQAFR